MLIQQCVLVMWAIPSYQVAHAVHVALDGTSHWLGIHVQPVPVGPILIILERQNVSPV